MCGGLDCQTCTVHIVHIKRLAHIEGRIPAVLTVCEQCKSHMGRP